MKSKGVLLDLDNTLYDYKSAHMPAIQSVFTYVKDTFSLEPDVIAASYDKARREIHIELSGTAASHNRLLYFQRMLEFLKLSTSAYALEIYELYWSVFLEHLKISDDVLEFLESVKSRLPICLVTDLTAHIQYRKIQKARLTKYIEHIVTSEEAGREKPHPYIFYLALKKIGIVATEACMIGDSYEKDIVGALNAGIQPFWLVRGTLPPGTPEGVTVFQNFRQLVEGNHFA